MLYPAALAFLISNSLVESLVIEILHLAKWFERIALREMGAVHDGWLPSGQRARWRNGYAAKARLDLCH